METIESVCRERDYWKNRYYDLNRMMDENGKRFRARLDFDQWKNKWFNWDYCFGSYQRSMKFYDNLNYENKVKLAFHLFQNMLYFCPKSE